MTATGAQLRGLADLLVALADPERTACSWAIRSQLGDAGSVIFRIDANPQLLDVKDRDTILSFAARLANWHHE